MTAFNGYPISVFLAVLLHGAVLGALLMFQQAESEVLDAVRPMVVKALLVSENPQARNERVQQQQVQQQQREREQQQQAREQREQQERERQEQLRQEQQRQEQARQTQLRQERERQQQAEQERAEQLRQEQQRQEEARRQEQERLEQQRLQEAERQRQEQAQAQADAAAGEAAETEAEMTMAYTAVIHDLVQRNWSRPPSARNDMTAVLRIRLVPTGDVVDVEIVRSSGDAAFDRAAENAVRAVGRFTELQGMPPRMFERSFRSLLLTFRPEDLLN
ncbi:energy transducer TonB [Pseudohongiella sp.]|nr:energy transducer TonB [Pseudohongiella sp.]